MVGGDEVTLIALPATNGGVAVIRAEDFSSAAPLVITRSGHRIYTTTPAEEVGRLVEEKLEK